MAQTGFVPPAPEVPPVVAGCHTVGCVAGLYVGKRVMGSTMEQFTSLFESEPMVWYTWLACQIPGLALIQNQVIPPPLVLSETLLPLTPVNFGRVVPEVPELGPGFVLP